MNDLSTTTPSTATPRRAPAPQPIPRYKLLLGFDFSEHAELALKHALSLLSARSNVQLYVIWAVPPQATSRLAPTEKDIERHHQQLTDHLHSTMREMEQAGYHFDQMETVVHVTTDTPANAIVRHAYLEGAHLVLVGTRDLGGLERLMLGSVAQQVMRDAQCPVMVCRKRASVPEPEPAPRPGEGSHLGQRHTYHYEGRNASSQINFPLLFPMS